MAPELPRVKVCGMTRAEDVEAALDAGADALGFVSYSVSPRDVTADLAAELVALVPSGVWSVAVLVDATPDSARAFLEETGARAVQLCGSENPWDWGGFGAPILRRVAVAPGALDVLETWRGVATGFVLDHPEGPGGTGRAVEPGLARELAAAAPCLLAGGLDAENVAARIEDVRPAGVDGSSRLEAGPGVKDPERVRAFVAAARTALARVEERA